MRGPIAVQRNVGFLSLLLIAWVVTRATALSMSLNFQMDEIYFAEFGAQIAGGSFPVGNPTYQYPPGAGLLFWVLHLPPGTFHRSFTALMLLSDALILGLLVWQVICRGASRRGPVVWVIGGYLAGGLMLERFDIVPTLIAVVALLVNTRPRLFGFLIGIGAMVKVWPILLLFAIGRRSIVSAAVASIAGGLVVMATATLIAPNSLSFLSGQAQRGLQVESLGAVPILIGSIVGWSSASTIDSFGASEVVSPAATFVTYSSLFIGAAVLIGLAWLKVSGRLERVPGVDVAFFAVLVFVVFNKVYSPQFFIWLVGIASVALLVRASCMLVPAFLVGLSMVPSKDFIGPQYWSLQAVQPVTVLLQSMRMTLMLAAVVVGGVYLLRMARRVSPENDTPAVPS